MSETDGSPASVPEPQAQGRHAGAVALTKAEPAGSAAKPTVWTTRMQVRPPTGEPDAGDLPVRFGGRGRLHSPYPYRMKPRVNVSAGWYQVLVPLRLAAH